MSPKMQVKRLGRICPAKTSSPLRRFKFAPLDIAFIAQQAKRYRLARYPKTLLDRRVLDQAVIRTALKKEKTVGLFQRVDQEGVRCNTSNNASVLRHFLKFRYAKTVGSLGSPPTNCTSATARVKVLITQSTQSPVK
ncbi:unnamed protein product [Sphagnum tenellum]